MLIMHVMFVYNYIGCLDISPLFTMIKIYLSIPGEIIQTSFCCPNWYKSCIHMPEPINLVVALLFYVHGKHLRSCRDGQLT